MPNRPFPFTRGDGSIAAVTEAAFTRHHRELHRHCARIVGAGDADDALQETFLRAWRARGTNRGALRPWLYRIATNVCCDLLAKRATHLPLDEDAVAPGDESPEAIVVAKETIELALLTAMRRLPARQHASLVARDLLRCSAGQTAGAMSLSVPATNSALQRARRGLRSHLGRDRLDWPAERPTAVERHVLEGLACF